MIHPRSLTLFILTCVATAGAQSPTLPSGTTGGFLRTYSNVKEPHTPIDISKASAHGDYVQAALLGNGKWGAVRKNGTIVSNFKPIDGIEGVASITSKAILYKDGRIELIGERNKGALTNQATGPVVSTAGLTMAVLKGGKVGVWGRSLQRDTYTMPPDGLAGVVAISATHGLIDSRSYAVRSDGTVMTWGEESVQQILPKRIPKIQQLDGGWNHFVALTEDGLVLAWPENRPWTKVPDNLPRVIKIKAQCNITAAQKEDLTWVAWGDNAMGIVKIIDQIGPALDIVFEANGRGWGHLLWIEPQE